LTDSDFARAVQRLLDRTSHWTPARWAQRDRAESVHALVQRLADAGAVAEGRPTRPVPRLASDLALPDQLRVVAADLVAAGAESPALTEAVRATTRDLA
jgi:hypothetical protein